jgi:copper chaperone CopZ
MHDETEDYYWIIAQHSMGTYLHAIDGRTRVRLPELRDNPRAAARLRGKLRGLPGVTTAEANPLTGSVLVEYDNDRLSNDDILSTLGIDDASSTEQTSYFDDEASLSGRPEVRVGDIVAEKMIEFAAERLLLAVLA